ncbi:MAG: hypothetical protein IPP32_12330 [Bacteroidetes bacterium]|nr:hypothetical protein [Bacteroidota bacterium]
MKRTNEIIKSFDYSVNQTEELLSSLSGELRMLPLITTTIAKGQKIFRCRPIRKVSDIPHSESEISYRPDEKEIKTIGRCNWLESSKFYGSIKSGNEDENNKEKKYIPGDVTAIAEISDLARNDKDGSEVYAVGVWEAIEDFKLSVLKPPSTISSESLIVTEIRNAYNETFKNDNLSDDLIEFLELYGKHMVQKVGPDENEKYMISSLISETLLDFIPGMIYTSVQSDHKGLNVVMNPHDFVKYFALNHVVIGEYFKFKNHATFGAVSVCEDTNVIPFQYKLPSEKDRLIYSEIIALFIREGISRDYMADVLTKQLASQSQKVKV